MWCPLYGLLNNYVPFDFDFTLENNDIVITFDSCLEAGNQCTTKTKNHLNSALVDV